MMLALDALQRRYQAFDQFGVHSGFNDGEPVAADPVGMGLNLRVRHHITLPGMTLYRVWARSIARDCGGGEVFRLTPSSPATNAMRLRKGTRDRYRVFQNATTRW